MCILANLPTMWEDVIFYYQITPYSLSAGVLLDYWPIGSLPSPLPPTFKSYYCNCEKIWQNRTHQTLHHGPLLVLLTRPHLPISNTKTSIIFEHMFPFPPLLLVALALFYQCIGGSEMFPSTYWWNRHVSTKSHGNANRH
jgi:hypothetical protein